MRHATQLVTAFAVAAALVAISSADLQAHPTLKPVFKSNPDLEAMSPEAKALVAEGDELVAENRFGAARRKYRAAVKLVRDDGNLPITALRRIANAYYFEGSHESAAAALEELAEEAASFGDLVTEVWAIADAAWMYGKSGAAKTASKERSRAAWGGGQLHPSSGARDNIDTERLVVQLKRLLRSPYLPDEVRQEVQSKRLAELTILAGQARQ